MKLRDPASWLPLADSVSFVQPLREKYALQGIGVVESTMNKHWQFNGTFKTFTRNV